MRMKTGVLFWIEKILLAIALGSVVTGHITQKSQWNTYALATLGLAMLAHSVPPRESSPASDDSPSPAIAETPDPDTDHHENPETLSPAEALEARIKALENLLSNDLNPHSDYSLVSSPREELQEVQRFVSNLEENFQRHLGQITLDIQQGQGFNHRQSAELNQQLQQLHQGHQSQNQRLAQLEGQIGGLLEKFVEPMASDTSPATPENTLAEFSDKLNKLARAIAQLRKDQEQQQRHLQTLTKRLSSAS